MKYTTLDNVKKIAQRLISWMEKTYTKFPANGHEGQIMAWKGDKEAKWEDLSTMFTGMEELLAYGVQFDVTVADPHLTRIGNMSLHKSLPIQSQLKGCIAQADKVIYWLNESDWRFRKEPINQSVTLTVGDNYTLTADVFKSLRYEKQWVKIDGVACQINSIDAGTGVATLKINDNLVALSLTSGAKTIELGSVLNGYDGTVRVYCPAFYIKSEAEGNLRKVWLSTVKIDDSYTYQPAILLDAYRSTILNTVPSGMGYLSTLPQNSAISVVNTNGYCRGGGNRSDRDSYVDSDPFKTDLGKPRTNMPRATMRNYSKNANAYMLSYEQYKNIFYWLYVVEYANFNSQEAYNSALTDDGYHQGGVGPSITNVDGTKWSEYNGYYPLIPCGYGNDLGNGTGLKTVVLPATSSRGESTHYMARWRGFDNPFGDIWTNLDGIVIDTPLAGASDSSIQPTCYIITDPDNYTDSLSGIAEKADRSYKQPHREGWTKEWNLGNCADIVPKATGGDSTKYICDYYWVNYDDTPETLIVGGCASDGSGAGLGGFTSYIGVSSAWTTLGFRSVSGFLSFSSDN